LLRSFYIHGKMTSKLQKKHAEARRAGGASPRPRVLHVIPSFLVGELYDYRVEVAHGDAAGPNSNRGGERGDTDGVT
jgi:hypothetical protein